MVCRSTPRSRGSCICHYVVSHLFALLLLMMLFSPPLFSVYSFSIMGFFAFSFFSSLSSSSVSSSSQPRLFLSHHKFFCVLEALQDALHATEMLTPLCTIHQYILYTIHTMDIISQFSHRCPWFVSGSSPFPTLSPKNSSAVFFILSQFCLYFFSPKFYLHLSDGTAS